MGQHIGLASIKRIESSEKKFAHVIIVATKPDIVKQAPLYGELKDRGELVILCHTDQHYDYRYSGGVEKEFGLEIDFHMGIDGSLNDKYAQMTERFGEIIDFLVERGKVPIPYIHGDTSTAMAVGLGAILKRVACVHVEAGIRTLTPKAEIYKKFYQDFQSGKFKWEEYYKALQKRSNYELGSLEPYPEQVNTRMAEAATGFHAAPVELDREFLLAEGFSKEKIAVVGNSVADAVQRSLKSIGNSKILDEFPVLKKKEFIPIFIHRRETCEDENRFRVTINSIKKLVESGESVFLVSLFAFEAALDRYGYRHTINELLKKYPDNFIYTEAITYHADMINLMLHSPVVVADSGSMQEELNVLQVPCVTLRFGTDRGESLLAGSNILAPPIDSDFVVAIIKGAKNNDDMRATANIYGENVSAKIVDEVLKMLDDEIGLFVPEDKRLGLTIGQ
ncbi:MAG: UDP-N-acetylglucosamine 2-epimerase [Candidatus Nomurabacteria bacterium]|jgi:UDP-N-acetylglucosamine 2-epimerase (non-hydrolysing)|nr:UDP-N-acetylglucosamine 2-epimerase [Candidatus Nomurabacteria bacterium]